MISISMLKISKKLDKNNQSNDEFRKWVQEYIDLRIFANDNDTDYIYT